MLFRRWPEWQPEKKPERRGDDIRAAERRRRQDLLTAATAELPAALSWGERLLPLLFAAMETCWVYAVFLGLASINVFQSNDPLVPVWGPFVLILGSYWLTHYMERRAASEKEAKPSSPDDEGNTLRGVMPGTWLFITFAGVVTLLLIWLHLYVSTAFVLDPRWLLALLNDIFLFNSHAFQIFSIVGLTVYFCWRGMRLARRTINASNIFNTLRIGLGVIIAVILLRAGQENNGNVFHNEVMLLLLIPIFLFLSLAAHALARTTFIRRAHPVGLEGSIAEQESSLLLVLAPIGLILLFIAVVIGSLVSPAFLAGIQPVLVPFVVAFNWLADILTRVVIFLLTPIFWLISLIFAHFNPPHPRPLHFPQNSAQPSGPPPQAVVTVFTIIRIILPILLVLLAFFVLRWVFRRRRVRMAARRQEREVHESLWSWALFWAQLKSLWHALWRRFFPHPPQKAEEQAAMQQIEGVPSVRTIREIYRALLKKAALQGYARKKHETPFEFQQRLDEQVPLAEPQLEEITGAYAATRYGGIVPDEAEVAHVRRVWSELNQKWV